MVDLKKEITLQKQSSRCVPGKRCSENTQQIYRRTPMPKCDFNEVALQLVWNHTGNFTEITLRYECSPVNLLHIFWTPFLKNTSGWLLLTLGTWAIFAKRYMLDIWHGSKYVSVLNLLSLLTKCRKIMLKDHD